MHSCCNYVLYYIGGCTSLIQPLDVCAFKLAIERLATEHMQDNLDAYVKGQFNASARRALFTKWVGEAWEDVSRGVGSDFEVERPLKEGGGGGGGDRLLCSFEKPFKNKLVILPKDGFTITRATHKVCSYILA